MPDRHGGTYRLPGRPWHFSRDHLEPPGRPAFRGEDNRQVFREYGFGDAEIDALEKSGALIADPILGNDIATENVPMAQDADALKRTQTDA